MSIDILVFACVCVSRFNVPALISIKDGRSLMRKRTISTLIFEEAYILEQITFRYMTCNRLRKFEGNELCIETVSFEGCN